jgi:predicted nucleic acid-binding protein
MTMSDRFTIDTNILIYSVDVDSPAKQKRALELMDRALTGDCVLMLQSLAEFHHAVTRKGLMSRADATSVLDAWMGVFPTAGYGDETLKRAFKSSIKRQGAIWDLLLIETARDAGCRWILSEDVHDGADFGGVIVRNPLSGKVLPADLVQALRID